MTQPSEREQALAIYADVLREKAPMGEFVARTIVDNPNAADDRVVDAMLAFAALHDRPTEGGVVAMCPDARARAVVRQWQATTNAELPAVAVDELRFAISEALASLQAGEAAPVVPNPTRASGREPLGCPTPGACSCPSAQVVEGTHLAERVLALVDQHREAPFRSIEWLGNQIAALSTTQQSPTDQAQRLQDHMEQHYGVVLSASAWVAAVASLSTAPHPEERES